MNQQQILSIAFSCLFLIVGFLASASLRRWLKPYLEYLCPGLRMDPWLFEPIAESALPAEQRRFFETHTPDFLVRGFEPLGDYVIRRDGKQLSCTRYFLSRDRTEIGEITCYHKLQSFGCMSVLLDGFYIESGTTPIRDLPPPEHNLEFCILRSDVAKDVIDHHAACVARTAAARGTQPATLSRGDFCAVANYGRELSLRSLQQQGVLTD